MPFFKKCFSVSDFHVKSDFVILLTSPEPTAIMDSYVVVKLLKESSIDLQKFVVVNKSSDKEEAENSFQNLSTAVKHFLKDNIMYLGKISFDAFVHKSIINQELLCRNYLESPASKEIFAICAQFVKINQVANSHQSTFNL